MWLIQWAAENGLSWLISDGTVLGFAAVHPMKFALLAAIVFVLGFIAGYFMRGKVRPAESEKQVRARRLRWRDMDPFMLEFLLEFTYKHGPLAYAAQGGGWQILRDAGAIFECEDTGYDRNRGTWWFIDEQFRKKVLRRKKWIEKRIPEIRATGIYSIGSPGETPLASNPFEAGGYVGGRE